MYTIYHVTVFMSKSEKGLRYTFQAPLICYCWAIPWHARSSRISLKGPVVKCHHLNYHLTRDIDFLMVKSAFVHAHMNVNVCCC